MLTPTEDKWVTVVTYLRDLRDRWAYVTNLYSAHDVDEQWVFDEFRQNIDRVTADLYAYLEGCCVDSRPSGESPAGSCGDPFCTTSDTVRGVVVDGASAPIPRNCAGVDEAAERTRQDALARCQCVDGPDPCPVPEECAWADNPGRWINDA